MKKVLLNLLVCVSNIICILGIEGYCAASIIWFSDWAYSQNMRIILYVVGSSMLNYGIPYTVNKYNNLNKSIFRCLLFIDMGICTALTLMLCMFSLLLGTMPIKQIIFIFGIQLLLLMFLKKANDFI